MPAEGTIRSSEKRTLGSAFQAIKGQPAMAKQNHIFKKIRKGSQAEKLADVLIERPASSRARTISTVGMLAAYGMNLRISCTACPGEVLVTKDEMVDRFGEDTPLSEVKPGCAQCDCTALNVIPEQA